MKKKGLLCCFLACCFALLPLLAPLAWANEYSDKQAELDDVKRRMEDMEQRRAEARREAEAASSQLEDVAVRLTELQRESNVLQEENNRLQASIDENKSKLEAKQAELDQRVQIYRGRLRDIYINGQVNYLDVLLGANSFGDFASRMYLLQKLISSDVTLLDEIQAATNEIQERQDRLDAEQKELLHTKSVLDNKKASVEQAREERAYLLYKAQEKEQESLAEWDRLLVVSENIAAMLQRMEANGVTASTPDPEPTPAPQETADPSRPFIWPCRGPITSYFGWRTHPIFGTTKYHSGMDIGVDYGTPILAAGSGTIVYSGWLGGYGYAVMVDHGNGLVTLYAHNQELNVNEGQQVAQGDVIAYAGATGYATGPHCHFEVRVHGEVTEPLDYLQE